MRTGIRWSAVFILCNLILGLAVASAQDATGIVEPTTEATTAPVSEATTEPTSSSSTELTAQTKGISCDSDLILSLYLADRYFGFDKLHDTMMSISKDPSRIVDLTTLNRGQFAPLFDNLTIMNPTGISMTDEQRNNMSTMMSMSDTDMMNEMATVLDMGNLLTASTMAGEPDACASLRSELSRFYTVLASQDLRPSTSTTTTTSGETSPGDVMNFGATLSGANEVPDPGDADATGTAAVTVDMPNGQVCYTFNVQNIALPAQAAHIHRGAAGVKGDVVVPFTVVPDASGAASSCVKVDAALLSEIAQNPADFYVNVHTTEFPDGALRGQLSG